MKGRWGDGGEGEMGVILPKERGLVPKERGLVPKERGQASDRPNEERPDEERPDQDRPKQRRPRRLRCDCGGMAVTVLTVKVGVNGMYRVRMPLCKDCLRLEEVDD